MDSKRISNRKYDKYKRNQDAKRFYNSKEWIKCRELVLIRDRYLCRECFRNNKVTPADVVHHIKELSDYPKLALMLSNLESLCHRCHNRIHGKEKGMQEKKLNTKVNYIKMEPNKELG